MNGEKQQYQDSIIEMVKNIDDLKHLNSIYWFIKVKFLKKNAESLK